MGNQKLFGDQGDLAWEDCQVRQKIAVNVDGCHSGTESLLSLDSWLSLMQLCRRGVAVAFFLPLVWTSAVAADSPPPDFSDLSERLLPAVVNIATTQDVQSGPGQPAPQFPPGSPFEEFFKDFFEKRGEKPRERESGPRPRSLGSGFVISSDGYIVTNNHVIAGAAEVVVTFANDITLKATIVGRDPKTDLALLKVEPEHSLTSIEWGDSDAARVGNWVLAIGNPFGLGNTVTAGIISARARDINAGPFDDFLQTDAAINRGNSGGPLFNFNGVVIGIHSRISSRPDSNMHVSMPAFQADWKALKDSKALGKRSGGGRPRPAGTFLGVLAEDHAQGALVIEVRKDTPAFKAGLKKDDIIQKINDIQIKKAQSLTDEIRKFKPKTKVKITLLREEKEKVLEVELQQR